MARELRDLDEEILDCLVDAHRTMLSALSVPVPFEDLAGGRDQSTPLRSLVRKHAREVTAILKNNGRHADETGMFVVTSTAAATKTRVIFDTRATASLAHSEARLVIEALHAIERANAPIMLLTTVRCMREELCAALQNPADRAA